METRLSSMLDKFLTSKQKILALYAYCLDRLDETTFSSGGPKCDIRHSLVELSFSNKTTQPFQSVEESFSMFLETTDLLFKAGFNETLARTPRLLNGESMVICKRFVESSYFGHLAHHIVHLLNPFEQSDYFYFSFCTHLLLKLYNRKYFENILHEPAVMKKTIHAFSQMFFKEKVSKSQPILDHMKALFDYHPSKITRDSVSFANLNDPILNCSEDNFRPTFVYSIDLASTTLYRTEIKTGNNSLIKLPMFGFNSGGGCKWVEISGNQLYFTGITSGNKHLCNGVLCISIKRDCAFMTKPSMLCSRIDHASVYAEGFIYAISGYNKKPLLDCERFDFRVETWESMPPILSAANFCSAILYKPLRCIYVLGGADAMISSLIQSLDLESMSWTFLPFRLPHKGVKILCFDVPQVTSQVFFVQQGALYSFSPKTSQVDPLYYEAERIFGSSLYQNDAVTFLMVLNERVVGYNESNFYNEGTLYYSCNFGKTKSIQIGSLTSE